MLGIILVRIRVIDSAEAFCSLLTTDSTLAKNFLNIAYITCRNFEISCTKFSSLGRLAALVHHYNLLPFFVVEEKGKLRIFLILFYVCWKGEIIKAPNVWRL